ncbi:MAG: hypothetical protein NTW21_44635 [Verrucomicrobia bacterium]|nr:hypothetical protein [Verrucomicrobiota bacterium]
MNGDDYTRRQAARDADYERQYRAWVKSLPADQRRELEAQGLAEPDVARHGNGSAKGDAADSPLMREGDDPAIQPEPEPEPVKAACDVEAAWSTARHVLGEVLNHSNARLTAECIALVSGLIYSGDSMTAIAKRHGITRAAVSKRCVELTELLDLRDHQRRRHHPPAGVLPPHGRAPIRVRLVIQRLWPGNAPAGPRGPPRRPVQPLCPDQAPRQGVTASARPLVRPDGRRESTAHRQPMTSHPRGQSGSAEAVRPYPPPD